MNKNVTQKVIALCICLISLTSANAQLSSLFNFTNAPQILSGTNKAIGSAYRFIGVAPGVDAIVTIKSATGGATVQDLDDNNFAEPAYFSPIVRVPKNSTGTVEFKIDFVVIGTIIPKVMDSLSAVVMHIDGTSDLKEFGTINIAGGASTLRSSQPEIGVAKAGNNFTGTNHAGQPHNLPDNNPDPVTFTVKHRNVNSVTYTIGAVNTGNEDHRGQSLFLQASPLAAAVLPVKYVSFEAAPVDKNILLNWVISESTNHSHFEVERSFNSSDFNTVAVIIDGFTIGGGQTSFQCKDAIAGLNNAPVVYYRLKQYDLDGKYTYSKVVVIRFQQAAVKMEVMPNPFAEKIQVTYNATEKGTAILEILGVNGSKQISRQVSITKGDNIFSLENLGSLNNGMYIARLVVNESVVAVQKIVKN